MYRSRMFVFVSIFLGGLSALQSAEPEKTDGDRMVREYFRSETAKLTERALADVQSKSDWIEKRPEYHRQLREMLGLDPWPQRTPLEAKITGGSEEDEFRVENVHFQSMPGLYVTGNLYLPNDASADSKLPAILYVCGHGRIKKNGVSYGNKAHYQHHGAWFARNGYVCLTIDTIQLGEIEGLHHGTYREGMWWWHSRGYTPAGVEAWNGMRAIDYLVSRPEVDADRIGVTGRSGGGAYSWWVAALDERVKAAVPVAGITSLHNHIMGGAGRPDGCIEGHCDCMYMVNTYRWDFPLVAALVAPRALLISNTDKDPIFPLDGVVDVYNKTRRIYRLLGAEKKIGLQITEGPHLDTQELRVHAFHWFNKYLKGEDPLISTTATKFFEPEELKVFPKTGLPDDERVTTIHESFVPAAPKPSIPMDENEWQQLKDGWFTQLNEKVFRGWPNDEYQDDASLDVEKQKTPRIQVEATNPFVIDEYQFTSQDNIRLPFYLVRSNSTKLENITQLEFVVFGESSWERLGEMLKSSAEKLMQSGSLAERAIVFFPPRGVGPTAWGSTPVKRTHIRRRFALLGQTLAGMQVWDAIRAVAAVRSLSGLSDAKLHMTGREDAAITALYASLYVPDVVQVTLQELPPSHQDGPDLLNVLKYLDVPQVVGMAAGNSAVVIIDNASDHWDWPRMLDKKLGWGRLKTESRE
ncbi:alpha/beta hydrolase family protein [Thalassoroseus pseudoceratinae]|uniref:alpha/beta hydrolase family protein n=1 Tax=Thalassoroseus pseudoceratinae TaxID=2713176 RepID=UPI00197F3369|nr:acetylxylan esterase [Thalassoroseus pseudoceratinae]